MSRTNRSIVGVDHRTEQARGHRTTPRRGHLPGTTASRSRWASRAHSTAAVVLHLAAIIAANWATDRYGRVSVGLGLSATAGTLGAGATFTLRDTIQDRLGHIAVVALTFVGALLSAAVSPALALASGAAFLVSESADFAVYTALRARSRDAAVVASALVGSLVDSAIFLALAFGVPAVTGPAVAGQVLGKVEVAVLVWLGLRRWR